MKRKSVLVTVALTGILAMVAPAAANAAYQSGSRSCGSPSKVYITATTTGSTTHTHTAGGTAFPQNRFHSTATKWVTTKGFSTESWSVGAPTIQSGAGTVCLT